MRSSAERALRRAASGIQGAVEGAARPLVLIDGRSGSGKTTLAALVADALGDGTQVVALDDIYPGWDGLADGSETARRDVIEPYAAGRAATWHRWDWSAHRTAEAHHVDAARPLVVEGAGLLTPRSAALADVRVWLSCPAPVRRRRALARDGDAYRPFWDRWAAQEETHIATHDPQHLATLVFEVA
ncbi:hypothetical protein [Microbacterium telephonicum]|uniref:Uridine kinase n=1 Tax=Microbacterium telephonicum TaxID=1714841 RepID=A0A498C0Y7_9MICO|nr:hypothetical protein [Microbacterium telephonicum]RLK49295.1 hypothetical protein C7474_1436 [Microbacterium telephonicum]